MAGKVTLWKGVQVAMQSAISAAIAVNAITKAAPGVLTSASAHGIVTGEYFILTEVQGMIEVNNRIFRAAAASGSTLSLEGEDTTLYGTFTSGKIQKLTFGTNFSTLLDFNVSGGEYSEIDTTTIHDFQATSIPGLPSALVITSSSVWDVSDPGLIAAKKAADVVGLRAFLLTFQNQQKFLVNGYVGATLSPGGTAQEKVTTSLKITANGGSTTYAT
jgi:hypothetical protein